MSIESVYQIAGRGCVCTGTVEKGQVKKGDKVEALGYGKRTLAAAAGLETYLKTLDYLEAGDNAGVLLKVRASIYVLNKDEGGVGKPLKHLGQNMIYGRT